MGKTLLSHEAIAGRFSILADNATINLTVASGPYAAGETIGSYRIIRRLGAGGMGEVFLATDTLLHRDVALKFLARAHGDQTHDAAILAEARAASRLDHPNIGTIFGLERTASGQPFLVMAYYEGQTLAQRIRKGPITHQETTGIALQTARGLAAAHEQRIVHRDIKPSNLILTQDSTVKIVDFGIAKAMRSDNSTQTMSVSGTMAYLSPEQARGLTADQRSDLWALGVVIAEMLTTKPVFERDSDPATLYAILHSPAPVLPAEVPAALQAVVYRSLAKDPASRYQSASEMVHDLSALTAPVSGRQLSLYRKLASGAVQTGSRIWPLATVAVAVAAIAFIAAFTPLKNYFSAQPASPHVAALPISATGDDQALGDGLMETLTSRLSNYQSQNPNLWIVPISEVRRRKVADPSSAHKLLNANLVITCDLTHQGDNIHLLLNLIDTKDLRQLGSGEFTGTSSNLSGVEDEAVQRVATLLHLKGSPTSAAGSSESSTSYQSYLTALGYLQRYDQPGNVDRAITLLHQATDSDPNFALGFAWLGEAYRVKFALTKDQKLLAQAESSVNQALKLNSSLASIHMIMGRVQQNLGRLDLALSEYQRAVQAEPRNADAIVGLADVYSAEGRYTDAEVMYRRSAALRPDYWQGYNALGLFLKHQKRYDEAAEQFKKVIQLTPDNFAGYSNLAANYIDAGRLAEAEAPLEKASQLSPSYAFFANLGIFYTNEHKYQQAAAATEQALKLNARDWEVWESLGVIYQWLHEPAKAKPAFLHATSILDSEFERQPPQPDTLAEYAEMLAYSGNSSKARQQYEVALAMAPDDPSVLLSGASVYGTLGDVGRGLILANKAVAKGLTLKQLNDDPSVQWLLTKPAFHAPAK